MRLRRAVVAGVACLALWTGAAQAQRGPADAVLRELAGLGELTTLFNAGQGHTRMVLLLSPT